MLVSCSSILIKSKILCLSTGYSSKELEPGGKNGVPTRIKINALLPLSSLNENNTCLNHWNCSSPNIVGIGASGFVLNVLLSNPTNPTSKRVNANVCGDTLLV